MKIKNITIYVTCISIFAVSFILGNEIMNKNKAIHNTDIKTSNHTQITKEHDKNSITSINTIENNDILYDVHWENSWILDPAQQDNLLTDGNFYIKIKVLSSNPSMYLSENRLYGVATPYNVEILDNYNHSELSEEQTIYLYGGKVKVKDFVLRSDKDTISKLGFDKLSLDRQENSYISYSTNCDYDLVIGEEYIVIVGFSEAENAYFVPCQGYGVYKKNGKNDYKNVITDSLFEF